MLSIVCGLPGTGKTRVAKAIAERFNAFMLSTDEIRKESSVKPDYSNEGKFLVYDLMLKKADELVEKGNVVLDATFYKKFLREKAKAIAKSKGVSFYLVECMAEEEEIKRRLEGRIKRKKSKSDADFEVYKKLKQEFEKPDEKHLVYNGSEEDIARIANEIHLEEIKSALLRKEAYAECNDIKKIELKETHISMVFLNGIFAYKIKKPLKLDFLDYSTIDKRKYFCERELKINSLLSKEIYLEVAEIKEKEGRIKLGGNGRIIDYAVKMKQFPEECIMEKMLSGDAVNEGIVKEIALQIAEFHKKAERGKKISEHGGPKEIWGAFSNAFLVKDKIGRDAEVVEQKAKEFLEEKKLLFERRVAEGKIRNCHGDLHTGNIFIVKGRPIIFDAIEFNDSISCCDVAAEIAFMAMDLEFHKRKDLADVFVKEYEKITNDFEIENLMTFYKCYRASIRMMANAMAGRIETAREYAKLAREYALSL